MSTIFGRMDKFPEEYGGSINISPVSEENSQKIGEAMSDSDLTCINTLQSVKFTGVPAVFIVMEVIPDQVSPVI